MPFNRTFAPGRDRGFTLIETLVVVALTSVIMLAMVSALRSIGQGSDRVDMRLHRLDDYRVTERFIRNTLGRLSARQVTNGRGAGPLFEGAPDHVAWVGVMPARYGVGGRHFFRLGVEELDGVSALVLRYAPWVDEPDFPNWGGSAYQVLISGVQTISLRYEDPRILEATSAWGDAWLPVEELPSKVAITMQGEKLLVEHMVVPLRILPASDPRRRGSRDGTVAGGGQ